jgi:hypothetical protein
VTDELGLPRTGATERIGRGWWKRSTDNFTGSNDVTHVDFQDLPRSGSARYRPDRG